MRIPDFGRLLTYPIHALLGEVRKKGELVHPPVAPIVPIPKAEPAEIIEARWRLREALDRVPRDQAEVNRRRDELRALELPIPGLHRRGRLV